MDWFFKFPDMSRSDLREFKKSVDFAFTDFTRTYGESIEGFFEPLLMFLVSFEKFFINTPWPLIVLGILTLAWIGSRSILIVIGTFLSFMLIGYFGMWEDTMSTLAIILVATFLCISIGIPLGVAMARSNKVQATIVPVLDVMQTIPSFVYLIPVVMLLGIGKVPGLIAVCIYAIPPYSAFN
jgi:glycine betaine/proline transport system permease protein